MVKIKCNVCLNENNKFCTIKKVKIHVNKKRKCKAYIYDPSKLKTKKETPSIHFGYVEQEKARQKTKEKLKELKELVKVNPENKTARNLGLLDVNGLPVVEKSTNSKHPLTGDLSRFTTTAAKEDKDK